MRKEEIEFKLAAGTARIAIETIRTQLLGDGWTGPVKPLDATAGSVIVTKQPAKSVALIYIDTGLENAKITISATGTDFAEPKPK